MKIISLSEAKTHLSRYGRLCHKEPIIATVNGAPAFQLVPLGADDDIIDRLLEHNPAFGKLLKRRLKERTVGAKAAARRL
jgi:antitoxin (DNA-binding transcriptional repressor) of toxin-antitoxin stability system